VSSLIYWNVVAGVVVPALLAMLQVADWLMRGWLPSRCGEEPINNAAWTIARIPIEAIWPDLDDELELLAAEIERELAPRHAS
jgi:hypothetical protein